MGSINLFAIAGNVTKDAVLRHNAKGTAIATYTVASPHVYFDRDGKKHEETDFIMVATIGKQAENDAKYVKKGMAVAVSGQVRSWYNPEKKKGGYRFEAKDVQYLGRPSGNTSPVAGGNVPDDDIDDWLESYEKAAENYPDEARPAHVPAKR